MAMPRKFPEKYLVVKHVDELKVSHPLAFLTPFGTDTAAEKRKETAVAWARGRYWHRNEKEYKIPPEVIFDNVPVEGFRITDAVSRSTTDNKLFRIFDPRGFSCEISSYNLFDIIENSVLDHGLIHGKFIWARDAQVNYLAQSDDPEYLESLKPKEDYTPQIGDYIKTPKSQGILMGQYYVSRVTTILNVQNYSRYEQLLLVYDDKPWYIIDSGSSWRQYEMIRSLSKFTIVVEKQKVINPEIDPNAPNPLILHKTKQEQAAFSLTTDQMRSMYIETYFSDAPWRGKQDEYAKNQIKRVMEMEALEGKHLLPKEL